MLMVKIREDLGKRKLEIRHIFNFVKNIFREFSFYIRYSTYLLVTKWLKSGGKGRIIDVDVDQFAYYPINSFHTEFLPISLKIVGNGLTEKLEYVVHKTLLAMRVNIIIMTDKYESTG
jgi:hypothetical protein